MNIIVLDHDKKYSIYCHKEESLLHAMQREGIYVPAFCGGRGTCGKCGIRLLKGEGTARLIDKSCAKIIHREDENNFYLSCRFYPTSDCTVQLCSSTEQEFHVPGLDLPVRKLKRKYFLADTPAKAGIAIDIGTTTIALELIDLETGKTCGVYSGINRQRAWGADVISRISAACEGKGEELQQSIVSDLLNGISKLMYEAGILANDVKKIVISANTTMIHLLMGYDCATLGQAPYTPVNINLIQTCFGEIAGDISDIDFLGLEQIPVTILPGISAFIGADIVSGMLECDLAGQTQISMMIDFGTNAEMVIGNKLRCLAASAAAGPAFEGGNILWGTGSIPGAISSVNYKGSPAADKDGGFTCKTIDNKAPCGICGTGVLEAAAELVRHGIADETGLFDEEYFENGVVLAHTDGGEAICFTQEDLREIQLAKAAVRAGIEVLLKSFGTCAEDVDTVYLCGGFGFYMDVDKAVDIGLLPKGFKGKVKVLGNSSLAGARACLMHEEMINEAVFLAGHTEEVSLAMNADFNDFFMEYMGFEQ